MQVFSGLILFVTVVTSSIALDQYYASELEVADALHACKLRFQDDGEPSVAQCWRRTTLECLWMIFSSQPDSSKAEEQVM